MKGPPNPPRRLWLERMGTLLLALVLWYVIRQRTDTPKRVPRAVPATVLSKEPPRSASQP